MQAKVDALFGMYPDGLTIPAMKEVVKEVRQSHVTTLSKYNSRLFSMLLKPLVVIGRRQGVVCLQGSRAVSCYADT